MLEEQRTGSGAEPTPPDIAPRTVRALRVWPGACADPFVWATALAVFAGYAVISLFRLLQRNPTSWDLGIYTEYVKQLAHLHAPIVDIRTPGFDLLGDHFQPLVAVLAPFFRVFPSSTTLLVGQAVLVAASVFPISRLARDKLGLGASRAIAVAYGFSWGLQQLADFDFHEIALAVPLLAFSLSALASGRTRAAVCWALPLVFVKEDQGFTVAAIGLYLAIAGLHARVPTPRGGSRQSQHGGSRQSQPDIDAPRIAAGQFLLIWGFAWSFVAIAVIIPHFNPAHHYDYWSDGGILAPGGHLSVSGVFRQLVHAWPAKLETLALLLLPTAFIALRSPLVLIAVPGLLLRFLSTDSSFWGTLWHYNATVMPIVFVAAVDGLARIDVRPAVGADPSAGPAAALRLLRARWLCWLVRLPPRGWLVRLPPRGWLVRLPPRAGIRRFALVLMLVIAVPLAFQYPLSKLWQPSTYQISPRVAADEAAMAQVPDGATVLTTLDLLAPLAARTDTFWIGNNGNPVAQYIVFDGQDSDYSPAIKNVPAFIAGFYPPHTYTQIFASGDVYVFRRTR
jgi:uncharacterized membrane protein